jgi:hypothetical protein
MLLLGHAKRRGMLMACAHFETHDTNLAGTLRGAGPEDLPPLLNTRTTWNMLAATMTV